MNELKLIITAIIWGLAFIAQTKGGESLGPFTFNSIRFFIGSITLIPVTIFIDKIEKNNNPQKCISNTNSWKNRDLLIGGALCGVMLCISTNFQQMGIYMGAQANKAGFLTACYILIVPILGIFLGRKCHFNIWIGVAIALVGLYLLCMDKGLNVHVSDILLLICAFCFSFHILTVDHYSPLVSGVKLSCIQFFVSGILTAVPMLIFEVFPKNGGPQAWLSSFTNSEGWISLIYAGILSCGVAYTLQILGQKGVNPTIASILLSLESAFAAIGGWIILGQTMNRRQFGGCVLIFAAVIIAQLNLSKTDKKPNIT